VKYLSAQLERLKSEDYAEDLPVSEANVLNGSFEEIIEDFVNALTSAPDELAVLDKNDEEVVVEEYCSLFLHDISHHVFTFGIEMEEQGIVSIL
jgi:predicted Zn-dependent protease with MMP-like domain